MVSRQWKWWLWGALAFLGAATAIATVRYEHEKRAQRQREATYERALHSYSDVLKPGTNRKEVEDYLHERDIGFRHMCCVDRRTYSLGIYDDLIKIGQEDAPWFCNEKNVYIALQFTGQSRADPTPEAVPSDTLKTITIYHWLEGCL